MVQFNAMTGYAGTIGSDLLSILAENGEVIKLFGRNLQKRQNLPINSACFTYDQLADDLTGTNALIHLAALNNDVKGEYKDFRAVNVDLTMRIAKAAQAAGCALFVNFTSTHAHKNARSHYGKSKYDAELALQGIAGMHIVNFRIPAYANGAAAGKLRLVNFLPVPLRSLSLQILSALRPTVRLSDIVVALRSLQNANSENWPRELLVSSRQNGNWVYASVKRTVDFTAAICLLAILLPFLVLIAVAVKITSQGPAIFVQERIGRNGRVFKCYKIRTMFQGTKVAGTHELSASNVTPLGNFLRRWKLDEAPQLVNVIRGDMSLVGPRPCLPTQHVLISLRESHGISAIPVGITGLSQIRNIDMSNPAKLAISDVEYLNLRSLLLDFKLMIQTARGSGKGDRVGTHTNTP